MLILIYIWSEVTTCTQFKISIILKVWVRNCIIYDTLLTHIIIHISNHIYRTITELLVLSHLFATYATSKQEPTIKSAYSQYQKVQPRQWVLFSKLLLQIKTLLVSIFIRFFVLLKFHFLNYYKPSCTLVSKTSSTTFIRLLWVDFPLHNHSQLLFPNFHCQEFRARGNKKHPSARCTLQPF